MHGTGPMKTWDCPAFCSGPGVHLRYFPARAARRQRADADPGCAWGEAARPGGRQLQAGITRSGQPVPFVTHASEGGVWLQPHLARPRRPRRRPHRTQRLDLPLDAHPVRRQCPRRPRPPHLRPHHDRHLTPRLCQPPGHTKIPKMRVPGRPTRTPLFRTVVRSRAT